MPKLRPNYRRYQAADPSSPSGRMAAAWINHSARFNPELSKMQTAITDAIPKVKKPSKQQAAKMLEVFMGESLKYVSVSMDSFAQYLAEYCTFYLLKRIEVEGQDLPEPQIQKLIEMIRNRITINTEENTWKDIAQKAAKSKSAKSKKPQNAEEQHLATVKKKATKKKPLKVSKKFVKHMEKKFNV